MVETYEIYIHQDPSLNNRWSVCCIIRYNALVAKVTFKYLVI